MQNLLFICSQAKLRSPTAEEIFRGYPGVETLCAGLDNDADTPLTSEMIQWADHILVMEKSHKSKMSKRFGAFLKDKRIKVLGIPDDYELMDPDLVKLLKSKVPKFVRL